MSDWVNSNGVLRRAGIFSGEIVRAGRTLDVFSVPNLTVNEGLNHSNDVLFHGTTQVATWYIGLFEGNYTPVATVTAATIASASTETTAYASATRVEYVEAASSSQVTTNAASRASFVFNATKTIYGGFLVSSSTKGGTGGTLFAAVRFATAKNVESGDEMLITYAHTATSV